MKEYLNRFIGKKIGLLRIGVSGDASMEGTLKEIVGEIAVLVNEDGEEWGVPLDKILLIGPPTGNVKGRSAGFLGD